MDKRLKKKTIDEDEILSSPALQTTLEEEDKIMIRTDKIKSSSSFMESMIYNLVHKIETIDNLNAQYSQSLIDVETYPRFIKYYVHVPYLLPTLLGALSYMKYKRLLSWNSGAAVVCLATLFNEFGRSRKLKNIDKEKTKEYDEFTNNYNYLIRTFVANNNYTNVLKYGLGINFEDKSVSWQKYFVDEEKNRKFIQDLYV